MFLANYFNKFPVSGKKMMKGGDRYCTTYPQYYPQQYPLLVHKKKIQEEQDFRANKI